MLHLEVFEALKHVYKGTQMLTITLLAIIGPLTEEAACHSSV